MYGFLGKKLLQIRTRGNSATQLYSLRYSTLKIVSGITSSSINQHSFTVSYLINSCGLSQETAISASKKLHLETSDRPDTVLTLFRNHGFNETHISILISKHPLVLLANPEKTLRPKLEFFHSIGFSSPDLAKIVSSHPNFLRRSLQHCIVPNFKYLKSILLTDKSFVAATKRGSWILVTDLHKNVVPNITVLQKMGVPQSNISMLLTNQPRSLLKKADRFSKIVNEIKEMGFNPLRSVFVLAIHGLCAVTKMTWQRKLEIYRGWGWSEDETISAFKKQPFCMMASEKKIMKVMDFLVNKMGWESSTISRCPVIIMLSLEKRIIPRCWVIQTLLSKGLIEKDVSLCTVLKLGEMYFMKNFVTKYKEEVPQLLEAYQGKTAQL